MGEILRNSTNLSAWGTGGRNLPYKVVYEAKKPKIQGKGSNNKKGMFMDIPEKKLHSMDLLKRKDKLECPHCGSNLVVNGTPMAGDSDEISFFRCVKCNFYWFRVKSNSKSGVGRYRISEKQEMLNARKKDEAEFAEMIRNYLNSIDYAKDIGFIQYLDWKSQNQTRIHNCGGLPVELTLPKGRVRHDTQLRLDLIFEYGRELTDDAKV